MSAVSVEVCEVIIDYVALENNAPIPSGLAPQYQLQRRQLDLVSCALTCRAWLPRSRYHLATRTLINGRLKLEQTTKLLKASPSQAALIHDLYVCSPPRPYSSLEDSHSFSHWSHLFPLRLSGVILNLEKLVLVDLNWRFLHPSFFVVAPRLTSTITTLWIYNLSFNNPGRLTAVLSMMPSLRTLEIVSANFDSSKRSDSGSRQISDFPDLQEVRLRRTSHIDPLLSWLSSRVRSLHSLALDVHKSSGPLCEFLREVPLLSKLHISFASRVPDAKLDEFIESLDFAALKCLRSLVVEVDNDIMPALAKPLLTMNGAALRTIALHLRTPVTSFSQFTADASPLWAALDTALSKQEKLERVTLQLKTSRGDYVIQGVLPETYKRRIVDVTFVEFEE